MTETRYLKLVDVADRLGLSERTVRRMVKDGDLPAYMFGGVYRVSEDELQRYIEAHRVKPEDGGGE